MSRRVSEETIDLIQILYFIGDLSVPEIAQKTKLPYSSVYAHTKGIERLIPRSEFEQYLKLRKEYTTSLLGSAGHLRFTGYDIKSLSNNGGDLVIKLLRDDVNFDKGFVEDDFRKSLEECLQSIGTHSDFEIRYENDKILIRPDGLESRAFLCAYKQVILKREVVK